MCIRDRPVAEGEAEGKTGRPARPPAAARRCRPSSDGHVSPPRLPRGSRSWGTPCPFPHHSGCPP
eukprot:11162460-Heterocapsa_arctica.AAC.1